jgi:translation initiation factor IF-2
LAKELKLNVKNSQLASALNLKGIKSRLGKNATPEESTEKAKKPTSAKSKKPLEGASKKDTKATTAQQSSDPVKDVEAKKVTPPASKAKVKEQPLGPTGKHIKDILPKVKPPAPKVEKAKEVKPSPKKDITKGEVKKAEVKEVKKVEEVKEKVKEEVKKVEEAPKKVVVKKKEPPLGPTGRHINDILPKKRKPVLKEVPKKEISKKPDSSAPKKKTDKNAKESTDSSRKFQGRQTLNIGENSDAKKKKAPGFKDFKDIKPAKRKGSQETRSRGQVRVDDNDRWRKRRPNKLKQEENEKKLAASRPSEISIRLPVSVKDLAQEMKLKSSQIISHMFMQGIVVTLNETFDDETTVQLIGEEFACAITIDTSEEKRLQITDKTVEEEIKDGNSEDLKEKPPVVTFMGHVDHGKTSLIDYIRKSQVAASESGAITQHIGAFSCYIPQGAVTILDTPGHEAFTAMRARGTSVTDIVVLVIAGDEGIRQQTVEALQHAKLAKVPIVVAINKKDKPNFDQEKIYRELADNSLLPEVWGGEVVTVCCSAVTGDGIDELLEMIHLQSEILELKANPKARARGSVLESEMHKGLGAVTTVLVQNGTLKKGDAIVFGRHWGIVKTMHNEHGKNLLEAPPSSPVELTGLSGLPEAGSEFIVVANAKEAKNIAETRKEQHRQTSLKISKPKGLEHLLQQAQESEKKVLNLIIRADVQGSLEALKTSLLKIESEKAELNITFAGIGEVSESDIELAAASKATILGFHTRIESHAETLIKELGVSVIQHDIIYHAIDEVKVLMTAILDKIEEEHIKAKLIVKATFKASQLGLIAGCEVLEGTAHRNNKIRLIRNGEPFWKGSMTSLKRNKDDVREVSKGFECGVLLKDFNDAQVDDILEMFEIKYISQEL